MKEGIGSPAPAATLATVLAFVRTYEHGSFTAAARRLHLTPAAVSRAVARLEAQLAVPLFRRTTRQLRPTRHGDAYHARCAEALALLAEAEAAVAAPGVACGRVRLSVPTTYGLHHLVPRLAALVDAHPQVTLELHVSNHVVDFVREGFDLAIRLGRIDDAGLVARKLGDASLGVFASPAYLARRGTPRTVDALADHATLPFVVPGTGRVLPWLFAAPTRELAPAASVRTEGDPAALIGLAVAGVGLCQLYHFMVARELKDGALVEVLARHRGRTRPFSLVYPRAPVSTATRAVIDHVLATR